MKRTILIVDDVDLNREMLREILEEDYEVVEAEDGEKALRLLCSPNYSFDVMLLDLMMPVMDGFAVLEEMEERGLLEKIPVLVISSEQSFKIEKRCFEFEIVDFIRKPFDANVVRRRCQNTAQLFAYKKLLEEKVKQQTRVLYEQNAKLFEQAAKLKKNNETIIDILGNVVESRNLESGEHVKRVRDYTNILAYEMMKKYPEYGLTPASIDLISAASALHDIGKICIPDNILLKPGKLTDEEYEVMKTHTTKGCEVLDNIKDAWEDDYDKASYEICRYHHERFDGRGYPDGLKEDDIPISAQLVSVADVYDALVHDRVYKKAFPKDVAFQMILDGKCGTFSPKLMDCFTSVREKFEAF